LVKQQIKQQMLWAIYPKVKLRLEEEDVENRVVEDVENRVKVEKVEDVAANVAVKEEEKAEEVDVENHVKAEDVERAENRVEVVEEVEEDADVKLFYNI
jgi:hypothetical protein